MTQFFQIRSLLVEHCAQRRLPFFHPSESARRRNRVNRRASELQEREMCAAGENSADIIDRRAMVEYGLRLLFQLGVAKLELNTKPHYRIADGERLGFPPVDDDSGWWEFITEVRGRRGCSRSRGFSGNPGGRTCGTLSVENSLQRSRSGR